MRRQYVRLDMLEYVLLLFWGERNGWAGNFGDKNSPSLSSASSFAGQISTLEERSGAQPTESTDEE